VYKSVSANKMSQFGLFRDLPKKSPKPGCNWRVPKTAFLGLFVIFGISFFYFVESFDKIRFFLFKVGIHLIFRHVLGPTKKGPKTRVLLGGGRKNGHFWEFFTIFCNFIKLL
jgi:hypothetical protein